MGFESPLSLYLLLLAPPLILLYFLKLRRERLQVPSLVLWRQVLEDKRVNSPFQRFKRHLLLLLQLLLLCLLAFAAARPFVFGEASEERLLPILIDNSASMGAVDEPGGLSRLEKAKREAERVVKGKPSGQKIALVSFNKGALRVCDFSDSSGELTAAIRRIEVEDLPSKLEDALRLLQGMTREKAFGEALLISDGNFEERPNFALPFKLDFRKIQGEGRNAGVTALNARFDGSGAWSVFAEITRSDARTPVEVELYIDGKPAGSETLPPGASSSERVSFESGGSGGRLVEIRLRPQGHDALACDDRAWLALPEQRQLLAYVEPSLEAVSSALRGLKGLAFVERPAEGLDLIAAKSEKLLAIPCRTALGVGALPPDLKELLKIDDKSSSVVDWRRDEPLLLHAQLSETIVSGSPRFLDAKAEAKAERLGYETLIAGSEGPLALKRSAGGASSFFLLFDVEKSTLPYRIAFPILMANMASVARAQAGLGDVAAPRTGVLPELVFKPGERCEVLAPDGKRLSGTASGSGLLSGVPASKAGVYKVKPASSPALELGVSLLDKRESLLEGVESLSFEGMAVKAESKPVRSAKRLWPLLAALAFAVLLVEWLLFNKAPAGLKRKGLWALLAAALALPCGLDAQAVSRQAPPTPTQFSMTPLVAAQKANAPMSVEASFANNGSAPLTGKLSIELLEGERPMARLLAGETALAPGVQRKRLLLPPLGNVNGITAARASLLSDAGALELGRCLFNAQTLPSDGAPHLLFVRTEGAKSPSHELARRLAPEVCVPAKVEKKGEGAQKNVNAPFNQFRYQEPQTVENLLETGSVLKKSKISSLQRELFPSSPEALCDFDIVVLRENAFAELDAKQLDALARWLLAGGALCLDPGKAVLQERHLEFLRGVSKASERRLPDFALDANGRLEKPEDCDEMERAFCGLGRLALLFKSPSSEDDFSSREWRKAAAFLWRLRASRVESFAASGELLKLDEKVNDGDSAYGRVNSVEELLYPGSSFNFDGEDYRLTRFSLESIGANDLRVPRYAIVLALLSLAILTGPLEYYVLGKLKLRVLTWIVFPATCATATLLLTLYAERKIGLFDRQATIEVSDTAANGATVFKKRIEFVFPGKSRIMEAEFRNEVFVTPRRNWRADGMEPAWTLEGSCFSNYRTSLELRQWTPKLYETASFPALETERPPLPFPERLSASALETFSKSFVSLCASAGDEGAVFYARGGEQHLSSPGVEQFGAGFASSLKTALSSHSYPRNGNMDKERFPLFIGGAPLSKAHAFETDDALWMERGAELLIAARKDGSKIQIFKRKYGAER